MTEDILLPSDFPAVSRKKVAADFEGGLISSDDGLVLLREAERRLGLSETLAGCIREWRDPERVVHARQAMLHFRMFAIACGYEDADDCDALRGDPLFKLAVGRAPESGRDLCSQPTMIRLENAQSRVEVARMRRPPWSTSSAAPFRSRRRRSRWTSTTPAIRCTAASSCRCSTPATIPGASCRSMSTTMPSSSRASAAQLAPMQKTVIVGFGGPDRVAEHHRPGRGPAEIAEILDAARARRRLELRLEHDAVAGAVRVVDPNVLIPGHRRLDRLAAPEGLPAVARAQSNLDPGNPGGAALRHLVGSSLVARTSATR